MAINVYGDLPTQNRSRSCAVGIMQPATGVGVATFTQKKAWDIGVAVCVGGRIGISVAVAVGVAAAVGVAGSVDGNVPHAVNNNKLRSVRSRRKSDRMDFMFYEQPPFWNGGCFSGYFKLQALALSSHAQA